MFSLTRHRECISARHGTMSFKGEKVECKSHKINASTIWRDSR